MRTIVKREIKNYLKRPLFWIGVLIVILGIYQNLRPYLMIPYISSEKEFVQDNPETVYDADITDGYVPTKEGDRRNLWEETVQKRLISDFNMEQIEAQNVIKEMRKMNIKDACTYLEKKYHYYNAIYSWEDTAYHRGTKKEINSYIKSNLEHKSFSYYFSRKFADFSGLYMAFFATVMLAFLFWQDTRKNTYELLHTKPVSAEKYILGKIIGGYSVCLIVLAILNLIFWTICCVYTKNSGFEVNLLDFLVATGLYILPNMLMIVCVYGLVSLLFKNPIPAVPILILYMVYSNMGSKNAEGMFGYYGRPFAIMVRFPGRFFDVTPPPMAMLNQSFLLLASIGILLLCMQLWKRRRM
ncbi:MAG: ABC transporter permease subunit [Lachnospiraceae bacterium]|nr:ABC transporter permease subunit [Lachnospiraceae bacterium]